ncbi:hypothetical protein GGF37_007461, partial [Kickxella alabastrina]
SSHSALLPWLLFLPPLSCAPMPMLMPLLKPRPPPKQLPSRRVDLAAGDGSSATGGAGVAGTTSSACA